jgi:hypothetical protein
MAYGDGSQAIRNHAWKTILEPAWKRGTPTVSVRIKKLMREMEAEGFPRNQPRNFCLALQRRSFLAEMKEKGIYLDRVEGPPSGGPSPAAVLHFHVAPRGHRRNGKSTPPETSRQRAEHLVGQLSGLFREEIKAQGGAEAVIRWLRSDED